MAFTTANIKRREYSVVVKDDETPGPDKIIIKLWVSDGIHEAVGTAVVPWDDDETARGDSITDAESELVATFT